MFRARITMLREHPSTGGVAANRPAQHFLGGEFETPEEVRDLVQGAATDLDWMIVNDGWSVIPVAQIARIDIVDLDKEADRLHASIPGEYLAGATPSDRVVESSV